MTNTVRLRDVIASDLPIFFEQQPDPIANQMAAFPARDREAFMAHWTKILADDSNILKVVLYDEQLEKCGFTLARKEGEDFILTLNA